MRFRTEKKISNETFIIVVLTIIAAMFRWPGIGSPLTGDEGISFSRYGLIHWKDILFHYADTNQHSLFSLLSNFCMRLFGENEIYFRLPSFLAGIFAIAITYPVSRFLLNSKGSATVATCLLLFSSPHLGYSQEGRGYALTVFLSLLLVFSAMKFSQKSSTFLYGVFIIFSGFCMVVTLPSNVYFLAAATVFCLAIKQETIQKNKHLFNKNFVSLLIVFIVLFFFIVSYLYVIREGIRAGIENHSYVTVEFSKFLDIGTFLISPWSLWLYLLFIYGWLNLKSKQKSFQFLSIFLIPPILAIITGIIGFPRNYIYMLPFVMMLVAHGMVTIFFKIKQFHRLAGYFFMVVFLLTMTVTPIRFLVSNYHSRSNASAATMTEAKQVLSYAQQNIPQNQLIVILSGSLETSVLNYFFKQRIREDMLRFIHGEKPDKITFISHRNIPPQDYLIQGYYQNNFLTLPPESIKLIKAIGNLRLYELDRNIIRFIPAVYDPDYETKASTKSSQVFTLKNVNYPKLLGKQAISVKKNPENNIIISPFPIKTVDIKKGGSYILFIYIKKYEQNSIALLTEFDEMNWPPSTGYLNINLGSFVLPGSDFTWQMVFVLSPIKKGTRNLTEIMHLYDEISIFDGFQSFILFK